jgi:hypothetical protein
MIAEKEAAEGLSEDIKSGKNFYLYCPGTQKSQIDEKVMSILQDSF